jgi:hypothetical protein
MDANRSGIFLLRIRVYVRGLAGLAQGHATALPEDVHAKYLI